VVETAISNVADALATAVGETIEVIVDGVKAAFEVLFVRLSEDPYEWVEVIPDVTGYQLVGAGYCTSSLGQSYGGVLYENIPTAQECAVTCKDNTCIAEHGWTFAGLEYDIDFSRCWCLINKGSTADGSFNCSDGGSLTDIDQVNHGSLDQMVSLVSSVSALSNAGKLVV